MKLKLSKTMGEILTFTTDAPLANFFPSFFEASLNLTPEAQFKHPLVNSLSNHPVGTQQKSVSDRANIQD